MSSVTHMMLSILMELNIFVLHGSSTIVKVIMLLLKLWHFAARKAISDEIHLPYYYGTWNETMNIDVFFHYERATDN